MAAKLLHSKAIIKDANEIDILINPDAITCVNPCTGITVTIYLSDGNSIVVSKEEFNQLDL